MLPRCCCSEDPWYLRRAFSLQVCRYSLILGRSAHVLGFEWGYFILHRSCVGLYPLFGRYGRLWSSFGQMLSCCHLSLILCRSAHLLGFEWGLLGVILSRSLILGLLPWVRWYPVSNRGHILLRYKVLRPHFGTPCLVRCLSATILYRTLPFIWAICQALVVLWSNVELSKVASFVIFMWLFLMFTGRSQTAFLLVI